MGGFRPVGWVGGMCVGEYGRVGTIKVHLEPSDVCKVTNNHISRLNLFFLPSIKVVLRIEL